MPKHSISPPQAPQEMRNFDMTNPLLTLTQPSEIEDNQYELPQQALDTARDIVSAIKEKGDRALLEYAVQFGDLDSTESSWIIEREALQQAYFQLDLQTQELLQRTAQRIRDFATAQRAALSDLDYKIPGGRAGHQVSAVEVAGCYAPGGRFPLPSSVLMTAITAKVAGVEQVIVASPKPSQVTLAAAYLAGADRLLAVGGAQAIAALAYGVGVQSVDIIVGPGNLYVTAAKQIVSGKVRIDMLAGPSELVVLADASADPAMVASDLIAQAEHDPEARPILVSDSDDLIRDVNEELYRQLETLSTRNIALESLTHNGLAVMCQDIEAGIEVCNQLAPEHLEVIVSDSEAVIKDLKHYGGLFIGHQSAEVFGDYGLGPNHVLPTGGTARYTGGLSVMDFLRIRTWLKMDDTQSLPSDLVEDVSRLARIEGLEGHAKSAETRKTC
ncbi:MAG: histidinol dehydrogenase [Myxococcales bacterium]|nr:histidinol dehydrogenase [Myxococcales bacterium]